MSNVLTCMLVLFLPVFGNEAGNSRWVHALYLSVLEINHEPDSEDAEVKIKVFTNDLEDALRNATGERMSIHSDNLTQEDKSAITQYFDRHVHILVNDRKTSLQLTKNEITGDAIWLTFNVRCPAAWHEIHIDADYLMELFPTQSNVVTAREGEKKLFFNLKKSKSEASFKF